MCIDSLIDFRQRVELDYLNLLIFGFCVHSRSGESFKLIYCNSATTNGVFVAAGNSLSNRLKPMTLETQKTLALLQELLMALRANDADGYKSWLALGIEKLGRDIAGEVESGWMVPLLVEEERDRLMAWQLWVSP